MRFELEALSARPEDMTQAELADYLLRQLRGLADSIAGISEGENEIAYKAPPRSREGMIRYADGATWNPASVGKGPVVYDGNNWLPLYSTPGAILAALLTVDGPGSGLNADLLDSQSSAYYLNADNLNAGTLLAARMPALTGDVTSTAGTVATTIANNAVTLAKMAQLATGNVLGRITASTGNVEAIAFSQGFVALSIAQRDVLGDLYGTHMMAGDGSTSQPGFAFNSDNNTGIRRVGTDSMALVSAGSDRLTVISTGEWGVGITPTSRNNCNFQLGNSLGFPAAQVASTDVNALDDYEEGTWTSTITSATGSITSYTLNTAEYTKIGNRVLWYIEFTINTNGTAGTYLIASNFPFTFGQNHEGNGREAAALGWQLQAEGAASGSSVIIIKWDNTYPTDGGNGRSIRINGQYRV